jgi:hypothetical protein
MARKLINHTLNVRTDRPRGTDLAKKPDNSAVKSGEKEVVAADRLLVDRCLAGDVAAWEQLYRQCHTPLCGVIKSLVRPSGHDANLIDEIAAHVWYALVRNDGELLDRFVSGWNVPLTGFFAGLARIEMLHYFRAERRHHAREARTGRKCRGSMPLSDWQVDAMLDDFAATLTASEQLFLEKYLLSSDLEAAAADDSDISDASVWQHRHRIRSKLRAFFQDDDRSS